jgi:hypothetical protein
MYRSKEKLPSIQYLGVNSPRQRQRPPGGGGGGDGGGELGTEAGLTAMMSASHHGRLSSSPPTMLVASTYLLMDAIVPTAERWIDFEGDFYFESKREEQGNGRKQWV